MEVLGDHSPRISLIKASYVLGYLMLVRSRWKRVSVSEMRDKIAIAMLLSKLICILSYFWLLFHNQTYILKVVSIQQEKRATIIVFVELGGLGLVFFHRSDIFASLEVKRSNLYPCLTGGWHARRGAVSPMPGKGASFVELFFGVLKSQIISWIQNTCTWRTPK